MAFLGTINFSQQMHQQVQQQMEMMKQMSQGNVGNEIARLAPTTGPSTQPTNPLAAGPTPGGPTESFTSSAGDATSAASDWAKQQSLRGLSGGGGFLGAIGRAVSTLPPFSPMFPLPAATTQPTSQPTSRPAGDS